MISLLFLGVGAAIGSLATYYAAEVRFRVLQRRFANDQREAGMVAYTNGFAMGRVVGRGEVSTHVRDGKLEHWDADAETCWRNLIAPSTFSEEP